VCWTNFVAKQSYRDVKVCVANTTTKPRMISAGSYLGQVVPVSFLSEERKEKHLQEIFNRLRMSNLKFHIKKCCLFQQRVSFLGHVLTKDGIEVQSDKVEAVQNWPTSRNLTEL